MADHATMLKRAKAFGASLRAKTGSLLRPAEPVRTCQIPNLRALLTEALGTVDGGAFVEVGAYDGETFSNTSWLADNGWRGLYIEPSADFASLCAIRHRFNHVSVVRCAAGAEDGTLAFSQMGALSTLSDDAVTAYDDIDWAKSISRKRKAAVPTPVRRLDAILADGGWPSGFELLVVDVEGFEEQVFDGFDLDRWKPKVLIVELCDVHPDFPNDGALSQSAARVRAHIVDHGYTPIHTDPINSVFRRANGRLDR